MKYHYLSFLLGGGGGGRRDISTFVVYKHEYKNNAIYRLAPIYIEKTGGWNIKFIEKYERNYEINMIMFVYKSDIYKKVYRNGYEQII